MSENVIPLIEIIPIEEVDFLEGIEIESLYWHIFCHCTNRGISYCGLHINRSDSVSSNVRPDGTVSAKNWETEEGGELCGLCFTRVSKKCQWGCGCGECRFKVYSSWKFWKNH